MARLLPAALIGLTVLASLACGGLDASSDVVSGDGDAGVERYGKLARIRADDGGLVWEEVDGSSDEPPAGDSCDREVAETVTVPRGQSNARVEALVGDTHGKFAYVVFLDDGEMAWVPCDTLVLVPDEVEEVAPAPVPSPGGGGGGGVSAEVTKCQRACNSRCNGAQNKSKCVGQCRRDCAG